MDEYDFSDPNYDFGGRAAMLTRALREGQARANAEIAPMPGRMFGSLYSAPNPFQYFSQVLDKWGGRNDVERAEKEQEALNKEQLRRFDDISKQLATPGTKVLKRTLNALPADQEGPTGPEVEEQVPLDYSNPQDLAADNARRMGLASQMAKLALPQAQKVAQDYLSKGASFPDTLALLQAKQIEAGQQAAQRAVDKERNDALYRLTAAQQQQIASERNAAATERAAASQALAREKLDMQKQQQMEKKQADLEKKQAAYTALIDSMAPIEVGMNKLLQPVDPDNPDAKRKITPALAAYTGNLQQYRPDWAMSQATADAGKTLNALKDQVMLVNLASAKAAVGQSFGSMQIKEWDKFVNKLASLDRGLSEGELADNLSYIDSWMKEHRKEFDKKLAEAKTAMQGQGNGTWVLKPGADPKFKSSYDWVAQ